VLTEWSLPLPPLLLLLLLPLLLSLLCRCYPCCCCNCCPCCVTAASLLRHCCVTAASLLPLLRPCCHCCVPACTAASLLPLPAPGRAWTRYCTHPPWPAACRSPCCTSWRRSRRCFAPSPTRCCCYPGMGPTPGTCRRGRWPGRWCVCGARDHELAHTCTPAHTHTHTPAITHAQSHVRTHADTRAHTRACIPTPTHTL
jgi:hypothetical protein